MILSLNCGSSSVKFQVFDSKTKESLAKGLFDRIGQESPGLKFMTAAKGEVSIEKKQFSTHKEAIAVMKELLFHPAYGVIKTEAELVAVGHRVVHGGDKFSGSCIIDAGVLNTIKGLQEIAPLHNPPNIQGIEAAQSYFPSIPHVAVFDTAFHQTMPVHAYMYAVPLKWYKEYGVRRYGFHGASHYFVSRRALKLLDKRESKIITIHIGNGVSLAAIRDGKSVDTSMGFTPLEGSVMGTRSGDVDPAVLSFIMQKEGKTAKEVENILNKESGLYGFTGFSDMRDIQRLYYEGDKNAILITEIEMYRLKKYIGAYAAALGGVDAIVFTAGVGENSCWVRELVCKGLEFLGIELDSAKNKEAYGGFEGDISKEGTSVRVYVVPTNEEMVFVEEVLKLI